MKIRKYLIIGIISLLLLFAIRKVGIYWEEQHKIDLGNKYISNIMHYWNENKKLPDEQERELHKKLNPDPKGEYLEAWSVWPAYKKTNSSGFTLTFVEGFDGPYLTYDSTTKIWSTR